MLNFRSDRLLLLLTKCLGLIILPLFDILEVHELLLNKLVVGLVLLRQILLLMLMLLLVLLELIHHLV